MPLDRKKQSCGLFVVDCAAASVPANSTAAAAARLGPNIFAHPPPSKEVARLTMAPGAAAKERGASCTWSVF